MAFTVEDGTVVADANSYASVAYFESYFTDRGVDHSAMSNTQKEQALVRATDYVDKRFGRLFRGYRSSSSQELEWPRNDAYDDNDYPLSPVPKVLKQAVCEYAWRSHNLGELAPDPALSFNTRDSLGTGTTESASNVESLREKVGPIETETRFGSSSSSGVRTATGSSLTQADTIPAYPAADLLLEGIIESKRPTADICRG